MSKFQVIVLFLFIIAAIAGLATFATYKGSGSKNQLPSITIWGTFPANVFNQYLGEINLTSATPLRITYTEYKPEAFSQAFVNALALGQGPDVVLLPTDALLPQLNKLAYIPYTVLPKKDFYNNYIDEARIYLTDNGALAVPFTVDPMVMYWNRDIFNSAGLAKYPTTWEEFVGSNLKPGLVQKLTSKDQNGNIRKSAVALGDFANITNAREILGSLLLQIGNPVTGLSREGYITSAIDPYSSSKPVYAFSFFSQFANPTNINYSWNRGLPNDKTSFLAGNLATYFGFASEVYDLRNKNSNLNFDIAPLPQFAMGGERGGIKSLYGKMYGFSLVRNSTKLDGSFAIISILTNSQNLTKLSEKIYNTSVLRDVIAKGSTDPYIDIFNQSALISKTWLDIDPKQSNKIFGDLIQSIISGKRTVDQAVKDAHDIYDVTLKQAQ